MYSCIEIWVDNQCVYEEKMELYSIDLSYQGSDINIGFQPYLTKNELKASSSDTRMQDMNVYCLQFFDLALESSKVLAASRLCEHGIIDYIIITCLT